MNAHHNHVSTMEFVLVSPQVMNVNVYPASSELIVNLKTDKSYMQIPVTQ